MNWERRKQSEDWARITAYEYDKANSLLTFAEFCYEQGKTDGVREFAEWLTKTDYANGYFDTENGFVSVDKVLADYEKEDQNEQKIEFIPVINVDEIPFENTKETCAENGVREFAEKIKSHMMMYCQGRLEQQYCAMEVIDYIGKLMGEKDFSIDVEKEMAEYDLKIRADERAKTVDECKKIVMAECTTTCEYPFSPNCVECMTNKMEQLKEQTNV